MKVLNDLENIKVLKYNKSYFNAWNSFVFEAKNSTFLFQRNFMEYHKDRFEDYSLLIYKEEKLIALLPANIKNTTIYSHQGLSYGGLLLPNHIAFSDVLKVFYTLLKYISEKGIKKLVIKQIPNIYTLKPSGDLNYLFFILKAKLYRRDLSMTIILDKKLKYSKLRKREIKKAVNYNLKFIETDDFLPFWDTILIPNLLKTFGVSPVHSIEEIKALKQEFPNNIRQFNVMDNNQLLAGCTVFETKKVAHLQYISTKKDIKKGALDYLIHNLITDTYKDKDYLDFGISNENEGENVNLGLLNWKQSFGASGIAHDFYEIDVKNYSFLNDVFI